MNTSLNDLIIQKAFELWGIVGARVEFIAARENVVYKISSNAGHFALRLHRNGYRTDQELWSELQWMAAIAKGGIAVPSPILSLSGDLLQVVDGVQIDVLTWLSGATIHDALLKLEQPERTALFFKLGQTMAKFHIISDNWSRPKGFKRCIWDIDGLLGDTPLWGRFWENPALSVEEGELLKTFRRHAYKDLTGQTKNLDFGLIHADLVAMNIMVDGANLNIIDFDDGGFGFRLFEIATALLKHIDAPDYPELKKALIEGYISVRHIKLSCLDVFMALRATTYVGWNITRMHEKEGVERNARFIKTATTLTSAYLDR